MEWYQIVGYVLGLLMGITLGLIGAGGSALTVPIMVFLFQLDATLATTYSLFIVGLTSLFGSFKQIKEKRVAWDFVTLFGVPALRPPVLILFFMKTFTFLLPISD